jgi:hypothetical protein
MKTDTHPTFPWGRCEAFWSQNVGWWYCPRDRKGQKERERERERDRERERGRDIQADMYG